MMDLMTNGRAASIALITSLTYDSSDRSWSISLRGKVLATGNGDAPTVAEALIRINLDYVLDETKSRTRLHPSAQAIQPADHGQQAQEYQMSQIKSISYDIRFQTANEMGGNAGWAWRQTTVYADGSKEVTGSGALGKMRQRSKVPTVAGARRLLRGGTADESVWRPLLRAARITISER